MASRRNFRLSRNLEQLLAETEARVQQGRSALIPENNPPEAIGPETTAADYRIVPRVGDLNERLEGGALWETPKEGELKTPKVYDTEFVEDARPPQDNYGQGPNWSTRVSAHKFVPDEYGRLMSRAINRGNVKFGTVYVKFQNNGNVWKYERVPDTIYESFRLSTSKGKFINQYLNKYSYGQVTDDPNIQDMA